MCGIYGMVSLCGTPLRDPELFPVMGAALRHRGPDQQGAWRQFDAALGCQRLAIVDLRQQAVQPFSEPRSRYHLVCNGEIYNAQELRHIYHDFPFRSDSDVEVVLPVFLDRGPAGISDLDGMFGIAIWDTATHTLTLARDRAGEKPLFVVQKNGELWFASEMQALLSNPALARDLDETAVLQFLTLGYILEPRTAFREIRKIGAGTVVQFDAKGETTTTYWEPGDTVAAFESPEDSIVKLRVLLQEAVRRQMIADVPVGTFVSGGIDSAIITTLAAGLSSGGPIHTFTARFDAASYDESNWAAECAARLGATHREVIINEDSLGQALHAVTKGMAEPLADPAILPTYLLAREARESVKVILSGEGADELFGGYPTYVGHILAPGFQALPGFVRDTLRAAMQLFPASQGKVTFEYLLKRFFDGVERPGIARHLSWFGIGAAAMAGGALNRAAHSVELTGVSQEWHDANSAMLLDYRTYLRDNLLVKNDRATMLNSVEARMPFLSRDVANFAWGLPLNYKVRGLQTKWLLKKAAKAWVERSLIRRRKRGMSVPVAGWLNCGLKTEVDRLLDPGRLRRQGLFDADIVGQFLAQHRSGHFNHARPLWAMVTFQSWLEQWVTRSAG